MNRIIAVTCIIGLISITSCVRKKELSPYSLPSLVKAETEFIESNDDGSLFLVSRDGAYSKFSDGSEKVYETFPVSFFYVDWKSAQVLYDSTNNRFWVTTSQWVYEANGSEIVAYAADNVGRVSSHFSYVLSPEGDLMQLFYYRDYWDPNSGTADSEYYIEISTLDRGSNSWSGVETDLTVSSSYLTTPHAVYSNGKLFIATIPTYTVSNVHDASTHQLYPKSGASAISRSIASPLVSGDEVFGLNQLPSDGQTAGFFVFSNILENQVDHVSVASAAGNNSLGGVSKVLDKSGEEYVGYLQSFGEDGSLNSSTLGYILTMKIGQTSGTLKALQGSGDITNSGQITTLDVADNVVYLGTFKGLYIYNLETDEITSYFNNLLNPNEDF